MALQKILTDQLRRRSFLSAILFPASLLYGLGTRWRRHKATAGYKAHVPVVAIGNITAGGTGKTPFTIFMARTLLQQGHFPAICHRDYRGKWEYDNRLLSSNRSVLPECAEAADEARELALALPGVPVVGGADRRKSVQILARECPEVDVILLDDGFQYLKLHRDLCLVVHKKLAAGNGWLIPAGLMREPWSALKYSDAIILPVGEILPVTTTVPIIYGTTVPSGPYDRQGNPVEVDKNRPALLLSGIGNPELFARTADECGFTRYTHLALADHQRYDAKVINIVMQKSREAGVDYVLTTRKDMVKLPLLPLPVYWLGVNWEPADEEAGLLLHKLLGKLFYT